MYLWLMGILAKGNEEAKKQVALRAERKALWCLALGMSLLGHLPVALVILLGQNLGPSLLLIPRIDSPGFWTALHCVAVADVLARLVVVSIKVGCWLEAWGVLCQQHKLANSFWSLQGKQT